jgi:hypothetical protein
MFIVVDIQIMASGGRATDASDTVSTAPRSLARSTGTVPRRTARYTSAHTHTHTHTHTLITVFRITSPARKTGTAAPPAPERIPADRRI